MAALSISASYLLSLMTLILISFFLASSDFGRLMVKMPLSMKKKRRKDKLFWAIQIVDIPWHLSVFFLVLTQGFFVAINNHPERYRGKRWL